MKAEYCIKYDSCNCPLCPMDEESLRNGVFYPDDEICPLQAFCHEQWIRNQRKISKKVRNKDFYFTKKMLERNCIITSATEGQDPDHDLSEKDVDEEHWFKQHPEKHKLNEAQKAEIGLRLKRGLDLKEKRTNGRENSRSNSQSARDITIKL